ncbi:MAG: FAD-dependent oxidoreductase [Alphaproteobacteria bacterium]|nr:FAD-dependent oxidoreductase [Alphaproteobacteria bacterium]
MDTQPQPRRRVAVIGGGIAGLSAAWLLSRRQDVFLFEAEPRLGGHSHTVEVAHGGARIPVDTGFIVYNEENYPNLTALFQHLGVATEASSMSFAVSMEDGAFEYAGGNGARGVFARPGHMASPRFWRLLGEIVRFFSDARASLARGLDERTTLADFLDRGRYGSDFRDRHLLPMASAVWSGAPDRMLSFPCASFLRFFDNHGLLRLRNRPCWRTVTGGSRTYVRRLADDTAGTITAGLAAQRVVRENGGATIALGDGSQFRADHVVIATHADQALALLGDADGMETKALGAFRYSRNRTILHSDPSLMPRRKPAWASWNVIGGETAEPAAVTYWMNRLQNIDPAKPLFVTLNPPRPVRDDAVFGAFTYEHPQYDDGALAAQRSLTRRNGARNTWFCGSYLGYGFHEDALSSSIAIARAFGADPPWEAAP